MDSPQEIGRAVLTASATLAAIVPAAGAGALATSSARSPGPTALSGNRRRLGTADVPFTPAETRERNAAVAATAVKRERLPRSPGLLRGRSSAEGVVSAAEGVSRRMVLATPAVLACASVACAQAAERSRMIGSKTLVAYVTRSGNTRVIAETLHRALTADLFEIRPARPYPEDYEQHVAQATRERDSGFEPPLAAQLENIARYDEIYLGFPIWGQTAPPLIRSFLRAYDLTATTLRPFITHGGYGVGNSLSVLATHAKGARIEAPFVIEADQERRTLNEINGWLGRIRG